jgi:hypothetical protein
MLCYAFRIIQVKRFLVGVGVQVIRGGWNNKSKGYGFVSMMDPFEAARAIREKNGKYLCSRYIAVCFYIHFVNSMACKELTLLHISLPRPITVRKSTWKDRELDVVKTKEIKKRKVQESFGLS